MSGTRRTQPDFGLSGAKRPPFTAFFAALTKSLLIGPSAAAEGEVVAVQSHHSSGGRHLVLIAVVIVPFGADQLFTKDELLRLARSDLVARGISVSNLLLAAFRRP